MNHDGFCQAEVESETLSSHLRLAQLEADGGGKPSTDFTNR